ncbi:hypothetical protein KC19_10G022200 [Ceratodon purpureus]|uniref:Protein kinase domain-containing protein n=1 Tax=Ceratodon purpureus TaxID=3225 RepID=A0A8T0GFZ8_CERPU|nr:hypothetical protein KC19_10G022200 [Ceratodon purpureus]
MASSSQQPGLKFATESMSEEEITAAIEVSRVQGWSELKDGCQDGVALSCHGDSDAAIWEELKRSHPSVFVDFREGGELQLGRVIAEGGQATIYEARLKFDDMLAKVSNVKMVAKKVFNNNWDMLAKVSNEEMAAMMKTVPNVEMVANMEMVAKVFKMEGFSLADLQREWPQATKTPSKLVNFSKHRTFQMGGVVFGEAIGNCTSIYWGTILDNGKFAFLMQRCWGDLRSLINYRLNAKKSQQPHFLLVTTINIMGTIGIGKENLHARGVLHRDLKAANILVRETDDPLMGVTIFCQVADYESSMMVQGTGFWRAPEVLEDLQKPPSDRDASIWTEKVDIYSYAMTCYEVLTGLVPFDGCTKSHWKRVIDGERPLFPDYVDPRLQRLVERCWHKDPLERPTFEEIVCELKAMRYELGVLEYARHASQYLFCRLRHLRHKVNSLFKPSESG